MIRRDPTRIELTLDDIQEYHIKVKQENEAKRTASKTANSTNLLESSTTSAATGNAGNVPPHKSRAENVHERIGFNPMPRNT